MMTLPVLLAAAGDPMGHVKDVFIWGPISTHMVYAAVAGVLCILLFPALVKRLNTAGTPGRWFGMLEAILLFVRDEVAQPYLGKDSNKYLPIIWTFFFFILFCNLLGLVAFLDNTGPHTATSNLNVTAALGVIAFIIYHVIGIKKNGFIHYVKANLLVGPPFLWPLMIPVEIFGHLLKPGALAVRLFANMVAGHTMLAVLIMFCVLFNEGVSAITVGVGIASGLAAVALTFLEIFIAFLQAYIFTFLTTVFLSMALHPEH
ncbi:MAG: F0F1 ATP synthase subunit A [Planctomycetota bacterium]